MFSESVSLNYERVSDRELVTSYDRQKEKDDVIHKKKNIEFNG